MLGAAKVIPGMPRTEKGAREAAKRFGWLQRSVESQGGKNGMRTEYQPPTDVLVLIHPFLEANPDFLKPKRGNLFTRSPKQYGTSTDKYTAREVEVKYGSDQDRLVAMAGFIAGSEPLSGLSIDVGILSACHNACRSVYGDAFDVLPAATQISYTSDMYNLLVKMSAQNGGLDKMKCLELNGMVELLNVFIRLGWARKFPPPSNQVGCFF